MKKIVEKITSRVVVMLRELFGAGPAHKEEPVAKTAEAVRVADNVFTQMKDYAAYEVKTADVLLLRKRLKRFERLKARGGPEAAQAYRKLERQWKKVVRNKRNMLDKDAARHVDSVAEQKIPVSGSPVSAHVADPGLSTSTGSLA